MAPARYHPALVALHWLLAALIVFSLMKGTFSLKEIPNASPDKLFALRGHMVLGVAILVLMAARFAVRLGTPPSTINSCGATACCGAWRSASADGASLAGDPCKETAMGLIARIVVFLPALAFAAGAWSADKEAATGATIDRATWYDIRTSELIGKEVANKEGRALGEVEDLIVDVEGGHIPHVILSFGGVADLGDKLFVFPVNAFTRDANRDRLVLNVEREQLSKSRGFDRSNWPFDPPLRRASELRGANVKDADGKAAGEIEDLEVNLATGRVERVHFAQDGRKGPEPKRSLPLSAFAVPAERGGEIVLKQR